MALDIAIQCSVVLVTLQAQVVAQFLLISDSTYRNALISCANNILQYNVYAAFSIVDKVRNL